MGINREKNNSLLGRRDILKRLIDKLLHADDHPNKNGKGKSSLKLRYFIVLGLAGLLLLLISSLFSNNERDEKEMVTDSLDKEKMEVTQESTEAVPNEINQLASSYEQDLINMLNKIQGVSEAEVMVNLDSSDVNVYERNLISGVQTTNEEDQSGGTRRVEDRTEDTQIVLVRQGDTETPILVQTKQPEVRGVFIVAKGAEQATVKSWIIEAISSVLDVPSHKISVMPKD